MTRKDPSLTCTEQITYALRHLYRQYGYAQYRMSKFEEYELYARNRSFLVSEHILTFTDTDGKLLALKPDVTLSILKNSPDGAQGLQKVYYNENVYRTAPASHGYREIMQVGLECIGALDGFAVCEVVELAARSLEIIHPEYLLDLSHLGIVSGLLDAMGWEDRREVLDLIAAKNVPAAAALCRESGMDPRLSDALCALMELYGTPAQVLPVLEKLALPGAMTQALDELRQVCSLLSPYQAQLRLDFSIVNDMNYYSGIIFRGYLPGLASGVLAGGQYDHLVQRMGRTGQAIGFAVYMDQLERFAPPEPDWDADVLLLYGADAAQEAVLRAADDLRRQGLRVRAERTIPAGLRFRECRKVE